MNLMLSKSIQTANASAYGCYLLGVLFISFSFYSYHVYPRIHLAPLLLIVMGAGILIWGVWYQKVTGKSDV